MKTKEQISKFIRRSSGFFKTDMAYVLKGGFWMNSNFVFTTFLAFISSILFANLVSKNIYGNYQFILAMASTIAVFIPNGINSATIRSVAKGNEGDFLIATKFKLKWGFIAGVVSICVSIYYLINQNIGLSIALLAVALLMPLNFAFNTWAAYLQGRKDYKNYFFLNSLGSIISYGGLISVLLLKKDYLFLGIANILFALISNLVIHFLALKKIPPNKKTDSETTTYGTHLSIMGIPAGLASHLDSILLFHFLGAAPLAVYSFATLIPKKLTGGLKFLPSIIMPKFSEKSEEEVWDFFRIKIWWLVIFLAILSGIYVIISPFLFSLVFPQYVSSIPYTQLSALLFFSIIASIANNALMSQKKTKELYLLNLSTPIIKIALIIYLTIQFGIWGLIWAQLITILFQIFLPIFLLKRGLSLKSKKL